MPKLQAISESPVTLKFFHDKRLVIIGRDTEFLKDVCVRAFEDFPCQPYMPPRQSGDFEEFALER